MTASATFENYTTLTDVTNTGRLERWVDRFMKERRSCSATSDGEKT